MSSGETEKWFSRGLFGPYDAEFDGEPPENFDSHIAVPRMALPRGNFGACGMVDVTKGSSNPSDDDFTGILDYTTMSLEQAMKIYWLAKGIIANGSISFSSSASGTGNLREFSERNIPDTFPVQKETYLAYSWNETVNSGTQNGSKSFSMIGESGPYEPYNRVCGGKFYKSTYEMPFVIENGSDVKPPRSVSFMSARAGGSASKTYSLADYGYDNDNPIIYVCSPTPPSAFYENGNFKGYGFVQPLVQIDCVVSADASILRPFMRVPRDPNRSRDIFLRGGGQMYLCNVSYAGEDIHQTGLYDFSGTETTNRVNFMGSEMLLTIQGGEYGAQDNGNCTVSGGDSGITISYSDSDSKTLNGDLDNRNEKGVGTVFEGGGDANASASLEININEPEFYPYPEF